MFSPPYSAVNTSDKTLLVSLTTETIETSIRFEKQKNVYALHGRASGTRTSQTFEESSPKTGKLTEVVAMAKYLFSGNRVSELIVHNSGDPRFGMGGLYDDTFNRNDFMGMAYPKSKISKGSTWTVKVDGKTYVPNGEMIKTEDHQTAEYRFRVLDIRQLGSQTFVEIERRVDAKVKGYAVPVDAHYLWDIHEKDTITVDAMDGILVSGDFSTTLVQDDTSHSTSIKIRRR